MRSHWNTHALQYLMILLDERVIDRHARVIDDPVRDPEGISLPEGWPPNIREFVTEQQSEIFLPAPFSPKLEPRQLGNLYEIRTYTLKAGGIPGVIDRWSTQIAERIKLSPLAGAWYSELGGLNRWCHIWAYKDAAERFAVRERARNEGVWPPRGGQPGATLKQENMLVVPASFSPLH
jgi:NIPSNAP